MDIVQNKTQKISNRQRLRLFLARFIPILIEAIKLFEIIKKYQFLLSEPRLLVKNRKDCISYLIALRLYHMCAMGNNSQSKNFIQQIRLYDGDFAEDIEDVLPIVGENSGIFLELLNELKKGRQYFASYISTHSAELIEKAKAMKDKDPKLSKQLVDLFSAISGHEIDSLMQFRGDCEDWLHYALEYNIDFFINRINLFLDGGFDNSSRMQFQGLYKDFGDEKIRKEMIINNAVRNLWFYNQQLRYLYSLIDICVKAQSSPGWEGFRGPKGFWTDFDKYAKAFERGYGNIDFAQRLLEEKKKTRNELPQFWGGVWQKSSYHIQDQQLLERQGIAYMIRGTDIYILAQDGVLPRLLRDIKNKQFLGRNFIHPAASALTKIFEDRENELKAGRNEKIRDLIKLLLGMFGVPKLRKFRKLLRKRKSRLLRKLETETNDLIHRISAPFVDLDNFLQEQKAAMAKIDLEYIENKVKSLQSVAESSAKYRLSQLATGRFLKDLIAAVRIDGADRSAQLATLQIFQLMQFGHLNDIDFQKLEKLIADAIAVERKLRAIVYDYIQSELSKKFTIKVEDVVALEIINEENKQEKIKVANKGTFNKSLSNAA